MLVSLSSLSIVFDTRIKKNLFKNGERKKERINVVF